MNLIKIHAACFVRKDTLWKYGFYSNRLLWILFILRIDYFRVGPPCQDKAWIHQYIYFILHLFWELITSNLQCSEKIIKSECWCCELVIFVLWLVDGDYLVYFHIIFWIRDSQTLNFAYSKNWYWLTPSIFVIIFRVVWPFLMSNLIDSFFNIPSLPLLLLFSRSYIFVMLT